MFRSRFSNPAFKGFALALIAFFCVDHAAEALGTAATPAAPSIVKVSAYGRQKCIVLIWNEVRTPDVKEYHVMRYDAADKDKTVSLVAVLPKNKIVSQHAYQDNNVENGHTYVYFVTAKNVYGVEGPNSPLAPVGYAY